MKNIFDYSALRPTRRDRFARWFLCLCSLSYTPAFGQSAESPVFEASSVKPALAQSGTVARSSMRGGPGTADPGQITFTNVTLVNILLRAYDVKRYQVISPDWLVSRRYDIIAKIPQGTTKEQFNLMLQSLLAERFRLSLHHETREIPGYELVLGKNGPKLKVSSEEGLAVQNQPEPTSPPKMDVNGFPLLEHPGLVVMEGVKGGAVISYMTARAQPLSALVGKLSAEFILPILDKTGLTGNYDFTLEFAPQRPGAIPPVPSDAMDESGPNLITAIQQQLGLKLNPSKVPLNMLIIDRAEQAPTAN